MKVKVLEDDIADGDPRTCVSCPIALALLAVDGVDFASVGTKMARVRFAGRAEKEFSIYRLPAEAIRFIAQFDRGNKVEPFEMELEHLEGPIGSETPSQG